MFQHYCQIYIFRKENGHYAMPAINVEILVKFRDFLHSTHSVSGVNNLVLFHLHWRKTVLDCTKSQKIKKEILD